MGESPNEYGETAPWLTIPDESFMCVEHPCIVKSKNKGIEMLGGASALSQSLDLGIERTLALNFAPSDPSSRTILSLHHQTHDVLLKITVPRRTGRKRRRGSDDPFSNSHAEHESSHDAAHLLKSMRDNPVSYQMESVGKIDSSHVWRSMSDFVFSSKGSAFMKSVEKKLLPKEYTQLQQFQMNRSSGAHDSDVVPPTVLSTQSTPYHYFYRQNQAVLKTPNMDGTLRLNHSVTTKTFTHQWQYDTPSVPHDPMQGCPPLEQQPQQIRELVQLLRPLFEKQPIWTRRALLNQLPDTAPFFFAKHAMAYVAFTIRSGPWRDTLCRLGIDPRTDRKYRKFQTILLQIPQVHKDTDQNGSEEQSGRAWVRNRDTQSHRFTGTKPVPADGKVWQLCDMQDEQLKKLVDTEELFLRAQCETRYFGWYPNGAYAKIKILLKLKVDRLIEGRSVDPGIFERFLQFPDVVDTTHTSHGAGGGDLAHGYLKNVSKDELDWANAFRSIIRTQNGAVPAAGGMGRGRTSVAKPKTRLSYIDTEQDFEGDDQDSLYP